MPEFIDPVFAKTSPKRSILMTENEHFGLVFVKTRSTDLGTGLLKMFINSVFLDVPARQAIESGESIPWLLKRLQIRALGSL